MGLLTWGNASIAPADIGFDHPWYLTEGEPLEWAQDQKLVNIAQLTEWQIYSESAVPPGINKTVWLQNQLPLIPDQLQDACCHFLSRLHLEQADPSLRELLKAPYAWAARPEKR